MSELFDLIETALRNGFCVSFYRPENSLDLRIHVSQINPDMKPHEWEGKLRYDITVSGKHLYQMRNPEDAVANALETSVLRMQTVLTQQLFNPEPESDQ